MIPVGRAFELAAADDLDAVLAHQTANATLADTQAPLIQLLGHARPAVAAEAQAVLIADMGQEHHVAPLPMRRRPVRPSPESAIRNAHQAAQMAARQAAAIVGNILKPHGFWAAKNIAAFFRTSLMRRENHSHVD